MKTASAQRIMPVAGDGGRVDCARSADSDYQPAAGTLTFVPGETLKTVTLLINGDTKNEADETFLLVIATPTGATIGQGSGTAKILNDDAAPAVAINSLSQAEGQAGQTAFSFLVFLSKSATDTVTVQ